MLDRRVAVNRTGLGELWRSVEMQMVASTSKRSLRAPRMPASIMELEMVYQLCFPDYVSSHYSAQVPLCFKHQSILQLCELPHSFNQSFIRSSSCARKS